MTTEISDLEVKVEILLWIFRTRQTTLEDTPSGDLARVLTYAHKLGRPMAELGAIADGFSINLWQFIGAGGKVLDWRPSLTVADVRRATKIHKANIEGGEKPAQE